MMGFCNHWDIEISDSEIIELVEFYAEGQFSKFLIHQLFLKALIINNFISINFLF